MKKTIFTLVTLAFLGLSTANAQVGIGTVTPNESAILDLEATDKGFLPPRMDNAQRDAISSPVVGLTIFNIEVNCLQWYNGSEWYDACEGSLNTVPEDCTSGFIPPYLTADQTEIVDVTNALTGDTWMDRNLGAHTADRTPPSEAGGTDCWAWGNLYQWGRASDGHEYRNSGTSFLNASTAVPNDGNSWDGLFIVESVFPFDWLTPQDNFLWNTNVPSDPDDTMPGKGATDPCPAGYRVPTQSELDAERSTWTPGNDREGAIFSPLKMPVAGFRSSGDLADITNEGSFGYYHTSTVQNNNYSMYFYIDETGSNFQGGGRATGRSIRCIKD